MADPAGAQDTEVVLWVERPDRTLQRHEALTVQLADGGDLVTRRPAKSYHLRNGAILVDYEDDDEDEGTTVSYSRHGEPATTVGNVLFVALRPAAAPLAAASGESPQRLYVYGPSSARLVTAPRQDPGLPSQVDRWLEMNWEQ